MNPREKKTILLVEDEPTTLIYTSKIVGDFGYNVVTANSGADAVEIALSNKDINLIIMDIDLGEGIDGTEAAEKILRERDIPVVFLSSHVEPEIVEKTQKITSYGYVLKSSSSTVLDVSIKMAFKLFSANRKTVESEEKYRMLVESQLEVVSVWLPDTTLTFVNEAYCSLMGKTREELIGTKWIEFIPEHTRGKVLENYKTAIAAKQPYSYVHEVEGAAGTRWFRWNDVPLFDRQGNLLFFQSVGYDITDRKKIEDTLAEKSLFQRTLIDSIPAPIFYKDTEGRYIGFNKAYVDFFGKSESELIGKTVYDISPKELADVYYQKDNELFKNSGTQIYEAQVKDAGGNMHDVIFHKAVFKDAFGNLGGLIGAILDITDRKKMDNELIIAIQNSDIFREKAEQATRDKELLLREVHHRIKNNMNTITGLLHLQANAIKDQPAAVEALFDAGNRVQSMSLLYDKLYRSIEFKKMSIKEYFPVLIDEIVANFPNGKFVKVEKNIDDIVISAKILSSLGIIINEIITNIMKYAFFGRNDGLIKIEAYMVSDGARACIAITDNGIGMPESVDIKNTTGFGLKLVSMLAEQISGIIKIERENGTKFTLEFSI